jgi:hypothetical protein
MITPQLRALKKRIQKWHQATSNAGEPGFEPLFSQATSERIARAVHEIYAESFQSADVPGQSPRSYIEAITAIHKANGIELRTEIPAGLQTSAFEGANEAFKDAIKNALT